LSRFPEWKLPKAQINIPPQAEVDRFGPARLEEWIKSPLTLDKRIVFAPALGYILFVPQTNDRFVQREFTLKGTLDKTGNDYLLVLSNPPLRAAAGSEWQYEIVSLAKNGPVKYKLEQSPEGMALGREGRLTWKIPRGIQGTGKVTVSVTDASGKSIRHSFAVGFD
jgi:hypothetical protein